MKNIIKDVKKNCSDCSSEEVVEFLYKRGDFSYTSEHYREIWFFFLDAIKEVKSKVQARRLTIELYKLTPQKFDYIRRRMIAGGG